MCQACINYHDEDEMEYDELPHNHANHINPTDNATPSEQLRLNS